MIRLCWGRASAYHHRPLSTQNPMATIPNTEIPTTDSGTRIDSADLADPQFLEPLRLQMLKFAALQLSDPDLAEDAVQEALIGALKNANAFGGRAALKTWVFAILRNKIADVLRKRQRLNEVSTTSDEDDDLDRFFVSDGHWQRNARPTSWGEPASALESRDFWRIFEACLEHLPPQQAQAFMMREFIGLDSPEICSELAIGMSNLNVMLHRARLRLRNCLENNWFAPGESSC